MRHLQTLLATVITSTTIACISIGSQDANASGYYAPQPPPDRHESMPSKRHGYDWVPGYWQWRQGRHVWVRGHWVRERPGYRYHAPYWHNHNGRWTFRDGRYSRYRDSDRDGVPDRYDRRPRDRYRY
jgi:hypothetical protein